MEPIDPKFIVYIGKVENKTGYKDLIVSEIFVRSQREWMSLVEEILSLKKLEMKN